MRPSSHLPLVAAASFACGAAVCAATLLLAADGGASDHRASAVAVDDPERTGLPSFADAVSRAAPAVVMIRGHRPASQPAQRPGGRIESPSGASSVGCGVLITGDGLILTNRHVIDGAGAIEAELSDGRPLHVELLGTDPETDLAVLRAQDQDLPVVPIGDPNALRVGDVVLAIGNPFGIGQTVTMGIVSAKGRSHLGVVGIENFLQTDAAVNPGSSGGPLIDAEGRLVGINTVILSESGLSEGVGFAIPADMALRVAEGLAAAGHVERGWLGIAAQGLTAALVQRYALRAPHGVLIARVREDSPAARAGLRAGDVVSAVSGKAVHSSEDLREAVLAAGPTARLQLEIWRGSERIVAPVVTAERPAGGLRQAGIRATRCRPAAGDANGC
jgi:S1-C subfamily serine protease